jgi:hypothetical protein
MGGGFCCAAQPASEEEEAEEPEMGAKIGWALPPPAAPPPGYAAGEESGEARVQYVRASLTPPVHYGPGAWPLYYIPHPYIKAAHAVCARSRRLCTTASVRDT